MFARAEGTLASTDKYSSLALQTRIPLTEASVFGTYENHLTYYATEDTEEESRYCFMTIDIYISEHPRTVCRGQPHYFESCHHWHYAYANIEGVFQAFGLSHPKQLLRASRGFRRKYSANDGLPSQMSTLKEDCVQRLS
jgi:hypothetical protein